MRRFMKLPILLLLALALSAAACTEASDTADTADTEPAEDTAAAPTTEPVAEETTAEDDAAAPTEESTSDEAGDDAAAGGEVSGPVSALLIYPETGPLAAVAGDTIQAGFEAVNGLWNDTYPDRPMELQTCNDEGNPERGISCFERSGPEADIILGPHFGSVYNAVEPLVGDDTFLVSATPHATPEGDSTIFQTIATPEMAMQAAIGYMQDQGWESFGMLTSSDTTGNSALESAQAVADEAGIELVAEQFDPESQDLTSQVSTLASADIPGLFIWSSGAQVVTALRGVQNVGLEVPVFLNYSSMSRSLIELAGDALPEELLFTGSRAFAPETLGDPERTALIQDFAERYEEIAGSPPDWVAFAMADAAWVGMTAALHGEDTEAMVSWLEQGEEIPAFHAEYSYSDDDHIGLPESPIEILRWDGEEFVLTE